MEVSGTQFSLGILCLIVIVLAVIHGIRLRLNAAAHTANLSPAGSGGGLVTSRTKYHGQDVFRYGAPIRLFSLGIAISSVLLCLNLTRFNRTEMITYGMSPEEAIELEIPRTIVENKIPPPQLLTSVIEPIPEPMEAVEVPVYLDTIVRTIESDSMGVSQTGSQVEFAVPPLIQAEEDTAIVIIAERMPRFPGCEHIVGSNAEKYQCAEAKFLRYVYAQLRYPVMAREAGIEGKVVVAFVVEKDGTIGNIEILRDAGGGCGDETKRVIASMNSMDTLWTPGKQRGIPVRVRFTLPVYFKLK